MKIYRILTFTLMLIALCAGQAQALQFKDEGLAEGDTINLVDTIKRAEVHADTSFNSFWFNNSAGNPGNGYQGIFDYRIEGHFPLYQDVYGWDGKLVVRAEGLAAIDHPGVQNFWDDQLVDLTELFYQKTKTVDESYQVDFAFGKFANRRFFDKDEIAPDPFDIGERPFFGAIANTNNVFNQINQGRDNDTIYNQASGSYGFFGSIEDKTGNGFFDRWSYKQALAVAQMDNFGDNFYSVSEVAKSYGEKYKGKVTAGLLIGQDDVFRIGSQPDNSYFSYASWVQKWHSRLTSYFRYGVLSAADANGDDAATNHITSGIIAKLTKKDILATHIVWTENARNAANPIVNLNFWIHKFTPKFYASLFNIYRYDVPSGASPDGLDNNFFIGFNVTKVF